MNDEDLIDWLLKAKKCDLSPRDPRYVQDLEDFKKNALFVIGFLKGERDRYRESLKKEIERLQLDLKFDLEC